MQHRLLLLCGTVTLWNKRLWAIKMSNYGSRRRLTSETDGRESAACPGLPHSLGTKSVRAKGCSHEFFLVLKEHRPPTDTSCTIKKEEEEKKKKKKEKKTIY